MNCSSMYRRTWYDKVGGYKDNKKAEDFDLFRRIVFAGGKPIHIPHATFEYRQHSLEQANTVIQTENIIADLQEWIKILETEVIRVDLVCQGRDRTIYELENKLQKQITFRKLINRIKRIFE